MSSNPSRHYSNLTGTPHTEQRTRDIGWAGRDHAAELRRAIALAERRGEQLSHRTLRAIASLWEVTA